MDRSYFVCVTNNQSRYESRPLGKFQNNWTRPCRSSRTWSALSGHSEAWGRICRISWECARLHNHTTSSPPISTQVVESPLSGSEFGFKLSYSRHKVFQGHERLEHVAGDHDITVQPTYCSEKDDMGRSTFSTVPRTYDATSLVKSFANK